MVHEVPDNGLKRHLLSNCTDRLGLVGAEELLDPVIVIVRLGVAALVCRHDLDKEAVHRLQELILLNQAARLRKMSRQQWNA